MQYFSYCVVILIALDAVNCGNYTESDCVSIVATHGSLSLLFSHANPDNYGSTHYANNYEICWTISTVDSDHLKVTAVGFQLQSISGSSCLDYLEIFNTDNISADHLVGQYCGSTFNTYTTTGTKVIIGFTTDGSVTAAGFRIEVTGENNSDITSVNVGQVVGFTLLTVAIIVLGIIMMMFCVTSHYNKQRHPHVHHNHPEDVPHSHHPTSRTHSRASLHSNDGNHKHKK